MKLMIFAVAVAAITATMNSVALTPTDAAFALKVFISGSNVLDKQLQAHVAKICSADIIMMSNQATAPGNAQSAYLCTVNPAEIPVLGDQPLVIYKRSFGGTPMGVVPVLNPTAADSVARLDPASCVLVNGNRFQCTGTVNDTPIAGMSELEPTLFTGPNLLVSLPEQTQLPFAPGTENLQNDNAFDAFAMLAITYGIQVTRELRDELQRAQGLVIGSELEADMPSLSREQIASLFAGSIPTWDKFFVGSTKFTDLLPPDEKPTDLKINICRRSPGAGTQAQLNALFFNAPCHSAAAAPLRDNTATTWRVANAQNTAGTVKHDNIGSVAGMTGVASSAPAVHENQGPGDVERCMQLLNGSTVTRWGISINALERGTGGSKDYVRFIKIDGVAPTLQNVANNKYFDWAGLTLQWRILPYPGAVNNVPDANQLLVLQSIRDRSITPADVDVANDGLIRPAGSDYLIGNLVFPNAVSGIAPNFPFDINTPFMTAQCVAGGKANSCTPAKMINEAAL